MALYCHVAAPAACPSCLKGLMAPLGWGQEWELSALNSWVPDGRKVMEKRALGCLGGGAGKGCRLGSGLFSGRWVALLLFSLFPRLRWVACPM